MLSKSHTVILGFIVASGLTGVAGASERNAIRAVAPIVAGTLLATQDAEVRLVHHRNYRHGHRFGNRHHRYRPHSYRYGRRYRTYWYYDGYRYRSYRRYY